MAVVEHAADSGLPPPRSPRGCFPRDVPVVQVTRWRLRSAPRRVSTIAGVSRVGPVWLPFGEPWADEALPVL